MSIDWVDVIYMFLPLLQQGIKLVSEWLGHVMVKWENQLLTLVISVGIGLLGGDFLGVAWCGWEDDLIVFISCNLAAIGAAWVILSGLYEAVWDKLFQAASKIKGLRLVTKDKLPAG